MKFIYRFFVVLGVLFFCLLLAVGYFIIADPYNLRPIIMSMYQTTAIENDTSVIPATSRNQTNGTESTESKPAITERQAQALEAVGMDASNVPTQFTAEQISCFVSILGQSRVDAIVAGATPTPAEFFQAKGCM